MSGIRKEDKMDDARKKEILDKLAEAVVEYEEDMAKEWSQIALDEGLDAFEAIMNGLAAGMETVGELYDQQEYFVPEMLMCADALYAGLDILRPHINPADIKSMGQVVIGTVQGDVHDIGKNIIKLRRRTRHR
jgi:methanogenic corrinoid protein MtbC1